uniref:Beta-glucosidase n=1 Tax=Consolida orientalis TaxID=565971 RepID=F8R893_9MAGN|nr:beta-glucosidase [Consolida orientalis]
MSVVKIVHLVLDLLLVFNSFLFNPRALDYDDSDLNRKSFPDGFVFGTASSAYQYEGAYREDGRGLSIWDTYTHQHPERIVDGKNGDVAVNHYHQYKEDVALMKDMGMDAYRFSISWSRVLPSGKLSGGVNRKGIQFYNNLIDELVSKGLQPYVTLFHWDVPQQLEDEYGGFLSSHIVLDFQDYAELCYKEFGDRVKYWITINEPLSLSRDAYDEGKNAPGRCSQPDGNCTAGNSATEPYITGHNQLLAHAAAVKVYKKKYQGDQNGKIGITLSAVWMVPFSEAKIDNEAAQRAIEFSYGWFMDPLTHGEYPKIMQSLVGNRLPRFTKSQSDMVKGSYDFLGLNYYTANYAANRNNSIDVQKSYSTDCHCQLTKEKDGVSIGPKTALSWLRVYPIGILNLLKYTKEKYDNPIIYITENGIAEANNSTLSLEEALTDPMRIDYHRRHLSFALRAIKEGVNIKGYFAWSFLDNFEWVDGYTVRFGLNYVDFKTMKRYPKHASIWFKKFLVQ